MKLVILSCNTGEGHNSTARAIAQYAEAQGDTVEILDALTFWPAGTNRFLCEGQVFLYKNAPELFGAGYRFFEMVSEKTNEKREAGKKAGESLSRLVKRPSEKLYEELLSHRADAVISVHVFASLMLTEIRRAHGRTFPVFFVATDYTCSPGVALSDFDICFIPSEGVTEEFVSLGVAPETVKATGIPIREAFYTDVEKQEAKRQLDLPLDKRAVLMMSGSMGCGPIVETAEAILKVLPEDAVLVTVCGRNEKLYAELIALPEMGERLFPVGFSREIPLYMDAAELIITKAGGLSSTEAANKHLPMLFIDAIPGLESHNRDFFSDRGFALYAENPQEIALKVRYLLSDARRLGDMRRGLGECFTHHAAKEIHETVAAVAARKETT